MASVTSSSCGWRATAWRRSRSVWAVRGEPWSGCFNVHGRGFPAGLTRCSMIRRSIPDLETAYVERPDAESELAQFVAAFETAHVRGAAENLADFLPSNQHPQYLEILCEIVRIDLEFRWRGGQQRQLGDYCERFPELFANRQTLEAICFEEYRSRRLAGEAASPGEYEQNYGIDTGSWAVPDAGSSRAAAADRARPEFSQEMPRVGDNFLGFELIRELGRGSFATVYLAKQAEL